MLFPPVEGRPNLSFTDNDNQSGYYLSGTANVSYVVGTWNVPIITVGENNDNNSQNLFGWIGINGNPILAQTGTQAFISPLLGQTEYNTWITMYNGSTNIFTFFITPLVINPGDIVTCSIEYLSSGPHSGDFKFVLNNDSTNESYITYKTPSPSTTRTEAIWFIEAGNAGDSGAPATYAVKLAKFNYCTFKDCSAILNGVNGGITARSGNSLLNLNMNSQAGVGLAKNTNKTILSQLLYNDSSFSVISVK